MNVTHIAITSLLLMAVVSGCRREEPKPTDPFSPPAPKTAPQPTPPAGASPGMGSREPARSVSQTVDDVTVTAKVKAALLQAPDVKSTDINVDTLNGTVTLKGSVKTQSDRGRAVSIAQGVEGVKDVQNTLMVKGF